MPVLSRTSQVLLGGKEQINTNVCAWTNPTLQLRYLLPGFNELSNIYYFASFPITVSLHLSYIPYVWLTPLQPLSLLLCLSALLTVLTLLTVTVAHSQLAFQHISCAFASSSLLSQMGATFPWIRISEVLQRITTIKWPSLLRFSSQRTKGRTDFLRVCQRWKSSSMLLK